MTTLRVRVDGTPAPQGSKRHVGNGIMIEASKRLPEWRDRVAWRVKEANIRHDRIAGPVAVTIDFYLKPPAKGRKRYPTGPPDLDKLERAILDSLTVAGVFVDDAQVVTLTARKHYAVHEPPGADIFITELGSAEEQP